jgi:hypothetical protein
MLVFAVIASLLSVAGFIVAPGVARASNITANQIWSDLTGQYVIGVTGGSTSDGAQLETYTSEGHPDQFWRFDYTNYGYQQIVNVNSGKCMGVSGASTTRGANVIQWTCNGNPDQEWALGGTDSVNAYDTLVNENSGMCIGISGNYTGQGGQLVQWTCDGNADKQWIPDSAPWPGGDDNGSNWRACLLYASIGVCPANSDTDPINVVFNDPRGNALNDITGDLEAEGWASTSCYNPLVSFDAGGGLQPPSAVLATNVANNGCGPIGGTRDHVRMWASPDGHTVFMAASLEMTTSTCVGSLCNHQLVSFNEGRNELIADENKRLPGRTNFISNLEVEYTATSLQSVDFDGWIGLFNIGA